MRKVYVLTIYESNSEYLTDNVSYIEGIYASYEAANTADINLRSGKDSHTIGGTTIEEFEVFS